MLIVVGDDMLKASKIKTNDEEIYELREKGLTYAAIAEYYSQQGNPVSKEIISARCKTIYRLKKKKEPTRNTKNAINRQNITDKEIYEQRLKGLSYNAIADYFKEQGKEISLDTVRLRCKKIRAEKLKEENREVNEETLREGILKLKETKGATDEQMEQIAEVYGISLDENKSNLHNDENNSNDER